MEEGKVVLKLRVSRMCIRTSLRFPLCEFVCLLFCMSLFVFVRPSFYAFVFPCVCAGISAGAAGGRWVGMPPPAGIHRNRTNREAILTLCLRKQNGKKGKGKKKDEWEDTPPGWKAEGVCIHSGFPGVYNK